MDPSEEARTHSRDSRAFTNSRNERHATCDPSDSTALPSSGQEPFERDTLLLYAGTPLPSTATQLRDADRELLELASELLAHATDRLDLATELLEAATELLTPVTELPEPATERISAATELFHGDRFLVRRNPLSDNEFWLHVTVKNKVRVAV